MGRCWREFLLPLYLGLGLGPLLKRDPAMPDEAIDLDYLADNLSRWQLIGLTRWCGFTARALVFRPWKSGASKTRYILAMVLIGVLTTSRPHMA
jgi:hypothetical protein